MANLGNIRAISLDLDDTLWPIWPTIDRAEQLLHVWLEEHAPRTAAMFPSPAALRDLRNAVGQQLPQLAHDLTALRLESIRVALRRGGEDPGLAEPAFEVFYAERQNVTLYPDALPALEFLAARFPLVSLSNGNAELGRMGLAHFFVGSVAARDAGVMKPDPRIFHAAAREAGVAPHEVLHVGDDAQLDVLGARNSGMKAAWITRAGAAWAHGQAPDLVMTTLDELCEALAATSAA